LRGGPLGAQTRFRGDVHVDKVLSHLYHLKNQFEEARPEVENAPKVATQPEVEEVPEGHHPEDGNHNASSVHHRIGRSERPNSIVMGNHDEWEDDHEEIATNYEKSGESYY